MESLEVDGIGEVDLGRLRYLNIYIFNVLDSFQDNQEFFFKF